MSDNTLISRFRKQIKVEIDDKRYSVSNGGVDDIVKYKELCASISGLELSLEIFNDIIKKLGEDDED